MDVRLLDEGEARACLGSSDFAAAWDALHGACPWATGCQTIGFARAWYESYAEPYALLLVVAQAPDGHLSGLLALGRERASDRLVNLGAHQAEYHAWLARPDDGDGFIRAALHRLRAEYPGNMLRFRYLPPGAPLRWLDGDAKLARLAEVQPVSRPLLRLANEEGLFAERLRKKSNKSRLNRLRKTCGGELDGMELTAGGQLAEVIDEIAANYDRRQGEANATRPFAEDPRKRDFHLRLLREGVLHGYVLRAGPRFVSAILSLRSGGVLSVGVFAHAADLADCSPGKFGMAWLARDAARAGFGMIDLTPGGEWKDRFATDQDTVVDLTLRFSLSAARLNAGRRGLERSAKRMLAGLGITPERLRRAIGLRQ